MKKSLPKPEKYYKHVKGTVDFYPPQSIQFRRIIKNAERIFKLYGYEEIILPLLEEEGVFTKSVGETTDIVEKQMFKIEGKDIVLRPEGTAQVVRFYIENNLHKQKDFHKFFYLGSMFRGEKPQKGRLRQFYHMGCEVFGSHSPYVDVEVIMCAQSILESCGIKPFSLKINSVGCQKDKQRLIALLKERLGGFGHGLCQGCMRRIKQNPLRVLDCKEPACKKIVASLNLGDEYLCRACHQHFIEVCSLLDAFAVPYTYDSTLVRGLDYYTHTVFEFISSQLGAQNACGAGGRYNSLVQRMGGPEVAAMGFALGLERILLLLGEPTEHYGIDTFVTYTSKAVFKEAFSVMRMIRKAGISSDITYEVKTLKAQLRRAERQGAHLVVLAGEDELKESCVILRNMRESTQKKIHGNALISALKQEIKASKR